MRRGFWYYMVMATNGLTVKLSQGVKQAYMADVEIWTDEESAKSGDLDRAQTSIIAIGLELTFGEGYEGEGIVAHTNEGGDINDQYIEYYSDNAENFLELCSAKLGSYTADFQVAAITAIYPVTPAG